MRKALTLLLTIMLTFTVHAMAEEAPTLHTLWDMPLDVTADEYEKFIHDKISIQTERKPTDSGVNIKQRGVSDLVLFNVSACVDAAFDRYGKLAYIDISLRPNAETVYYASSERAKPHFVRVYESLREKYGDETHASFITTIRSEPNNKYEQYSIPKSNDRLDFDLIFEGMKLYPAGTSLNVTWDNVSLNLSTTDRCGMNIYIRTKSTVKDEDESPPFVLKSTDLSDAF